MLSACHEPEYVLPTADRQGLSSLTAIFTSGPFVDQEMAKLSISEDETSDRYVIQVPWYYPETSDDETAQYMSKVRVRAELQPNCNIEPGLGILDLTQENYFTYTNAQGVQRKICITGERVKSNKCELLAFSINEPVVAGVVNKGAKKVALITPDDLSACLAEAQVSPPCHHLARPVGSRHQLQRTGRVHRNGRQRGRQSRLYRDEGDSRKDSQGIQCQPYGTALQLRPGFQLRCA